MNSKAIVGLSVLLNVLAFGALSRMYIWPRLQTVPRLLAALAEQRQ